MTAYTRLVRTANIGAHSATWERAWGPTHVGLEGAAYGDAILASLFYIASAMGATGDDDLRKLAACGALAACACACACAHASQLYMVCAPWTLLGAATWPRPGHNRGGLWMWMLLLRGGLQFLARADCRRARAWPCNRPYS